jgi:hypothetical protein
MNSLNLPAIRWFPHRDAAAQRCIIKVQRCAILSRSRQVISFSPKTGLLHSGILFALLKLTFYFLRPRGNGRLAQLSFQE